MDVDFILKNLGDTIEKLEKLEEVSKEASQEDLMSLAYLIDLAYRIKERTIDIVNLSNHDLERTVMWLERASKLIPGVKGYQIEKTPNIKKMLEGRENKLKNKESIEV